MRDLIKTIISHLKITRAHEISRRYLVMNAFDGVLVILGLVMGSFAAGVVEPGFVISGGVGASIAMGISGSYGAYITERAERRRTLRELEREMFTELGDSLLEKALRTATLWVAFVDGVSPLAAATIALSPFFLSEAGWISPPTALWASIGLTLMILFFLGAYMGRISKENIFTHGFKMLLVGGVMALVFLLFKLLVP